MAVYSAVGAGAGSVVSAAGGWEVEMKEKLRRLLSMKDKDAKYALEELMAHIEEVKP